MDMATLHIAIAFGGFLVGILGCVLTVTVMIGTERFDVWLDKLSGHHEKVSAKRKRKMK